MGTGCLVLVDGWNHFLAVQRCFGHAAAVRFPLDRVALHLAAEAGADVVRDVVVVMAIPERDQDGESRDYWAWRKRLRKVQNYGVRHEKARFSYHQLTCAQCSTTLEHRVTCGNCGSSNAVAGRRKEKGADVKLATLALNGAWEAEYSSLVVLSQDSDFGPLIREVKRVHQVQGRRYDLYSAFPVCGRSDHEHRSIPGTRKLPLTSEVYQELIDRPGVHVTAQSLMIPAPAARPAPLDSIS